VESRAEMAAWSERLNAIMCSCSVAEDLTFAEIEPWISARREFMALIREIVATYAHYTAREVIKYLCNDTEYVLTEIYKNLHGDDNEFAFAHDVGKEYNDAVVFLPKIDVSHYDRLRDQIRVAIESVSIHSLPYEYPLTRVGSLDQRCEWQLIYPHHKIVGYGGSQAYVVAKRLLAMIVALCDGYLARVVASDTNIDRFFVIVEQLPYELQVIVVMRSQGLPGTTMRFSDAAFRMATKDD
jgi:hypothetical protein